jgi:hypothetical protein
VVAITIARAVSTPTNLIPLFIAVSFFVIQKCRKVFSVGPESNLTIALYGCSLA